MQQHSQRKYWFHIVYIMSFAGLGGVLYGYDIGVIAGALPYLQQDIHLNTNQLSIIVAAVLGGGALATLVSGVLADWFGRKRLIMAAAIIFILGILLLINAEQYFTVLLGRLIQGIGVGIVTIVVPLYLVEILPAQLRGRGVTLFQCFLTGGILLAAVVDFKLSSSGAWRHMFAMALIPAAILLFGAMLLAESPRWLFHQQKYALARQALAQCNPGQQVDLELAEMQKLSQTAQQQPSARLWQKRYFMPFLIALGIACANQLTGINSLLQFSTYILKNCGLSSDTVSMLGTIGITLTNFLVTILTFFLIDKLGRKRLMCFGTLGMTLALFILGALNYFLPIGPIQGYGVVLGMMVYIFCFAIGPGVIVWLALSELLPTAIRSKGMAICLFVNSLVSTLLASVFLRIAGYWGYAANFWLCAIFTLGYFVLVYCYLPEAKNKSLEQIEADFTKKFANS